MIQKQMVVVASAGVVVAVAAVAAVDAAVQIDVVEIGDLSKT